MTRTPGELHGCATRKSYGWIAYSILSCITYSEKHISLLLVGKTYIFL